MHRRVATLATDLETALAVLPGLRGRCEWAEVRLDALWPTVPGEEAATDALVRLTDAAHAADVPLLATLRPTRQGGAFDGLEEVRLGLLVAAARAGCAVDLESDHPDLHALRTALPEETPVVWSDHTFSAAPSKQEGMIHLQQMQDGHGHAEKLAHPARNLLDLLRALELIRAHAGRHGNPAVLPHGFGGAQARALLALAGNRLTYGHAPGTPPAVPGQPGLADIQAVWDHWGVTPDELGRDDGWYAVLGGDVRHSLSPRLHNAALRTAGRPERYGALDMPDSIGAMRLLATIAERIGLKGASVTTPLKLHAFHVAEPDDAARRVGAVNCIRFEECTAHGTNTDHTALRRLLRGQDMVAVLGAGGAARAAIAAAQDEGAAVTFTSRDPRRAQEVRDTLGAAWVPWDDRATIRADAWVQATPLGARPDDPSPLAEVQGRLAVEMVYASGPTRFQAHAQASGLTVVDGQTVLLEQALDAYRFWTGTDPDRAAMEAALRT